MKNLHRHLLLATALAAGLAVAPLATGSARAEESATVPTDPGFKPDTGQLNPGPTEQAYSKSADVRKVPTPAESRTALRAPDDPTSSLGSELPQPQGNAADGNKTTSPPGTGDVTAATQGQAAVGGPLSPGASASGQPSGAGNQQGAGTGETTGARSSTDLKQNRPGPIGATGQTMPAKFSQRNDILDRTPIMAWPLSLSDQDRQQIYQAVMADKTAAAEGAEALAPAAELNVNQALNEMHPMPASVSGINGVQTLDYVKTKDKVFLVAPATRTVVDEIDS
jgi:hypothetical protein